MANRIYREGCKVMGIMDRIVYRIKKITHSMAVLEAIEDNRKIIIGASALIFFTIIE